MTQPGYVSPLSPGWWVRTNRVGINGTGYDWEVTATGEKYPVGHGSGAYTWTGAATGLTPIVIYSATGAGNYSATGAPTWSHTAVAGDYVVVAISANSTGAITSCTYGGAAMTFLGLKYMNDASGNGFVAAYGITDATGGAKTIAVTRTGSSAAVGNSVSYKNVGAGSARNAWGVYGTFTAVPTQVTANPFGQSMLVQMFGCQSSMGSASGGTTRSGNIGSTGAFLTISDSSSSATTFTEANPSSAHWAGLSLILTPTPVGSSLYVKGLNVYQGNTSAIEIPAHVSGDLIVLYAYNAAGTATPTKPASGGTVPAWVDIDNNTGANSNSSRTARFVATASTTTSGVWANAYNMAAVVLSGQHATTFIGGHAESGSTSTQGSTAPSITMSQTNGTSQLLHFFSRQSATFTWNTAPAGYTRYSYLDGIATYGGVCVDIKNTTTSDGSVTNDTSATASIGYRGATVEVLD